MQTLSAFAERRARLLPAFKENRIGAFVSAALPNVRYLTGFTGSNGAILITPERSILFTDPRYATQSRQECDCDVKICKSPIAKNVASWVKRMHLKSLGFEHNRVSFEDHAQLREELKGVRLLGVRGLVEQLRLVKSAEEIAAVRASVVLNSQALERAIARFKEGMTEVDLAAEIEFQMKQLGAEGTSFDTIVASGARSALPHARPTSQPIRRNELLLIDMGATVAGYASDMTRTFAVGKISPEVRRQFEAVLTSQLAAIAVLRPGISCATVDRTVREILQGYGLEKQFIHSTGHGLGLEIHERPRIGRKETTRLEAGMTITIEPGVYVDGTNGVRIEDTVAITGSGCEVLTPTKKELVVL